MTCKFKEITKTMIRYFSDVLITDYHGFVNI